MTRRTHVKIIEVINAATSRMSKCFSGMSKTQPCLTIVQNRDGYAHGEVAISHTKGLSLSMISASTLSDGLLRSYLPTLTCGFTFHFQLTQNLAGHILHMDSNGSNIKSSYK